MENASSMPKTTNWSVRFVISLFIVTYWTTLARALELYSELRPCPNVLPQKIPDLDQLLGKWHLAYLILDATSEEYVENSLCVRGELQRLNASSLRQVWSVDVPGNGMLGEHNAMFDLPTRLLNPGDTARWVVQTPLGGEVQATVLDSNPNTYMVVSHCGLNKGSMVHLWTGITTRSPKLSPLQQLQLTSLLIQHGFNPALNKVITWNDC